MGAIQDSDWREWTRPGTKIQARRKGWGAVNQRAVRKKRGAVKESNGEAFRVCLTGTQRGNRREIALSVKREEVERAESLLGLSFRFL